MCCACATKLLLAGLAMTASKNSKTGLKLYSRTSLVTERGDWQAQLVLLHDTDSDCSLIN